eukprot:GHVR01173387.1.p1 GENE.GHVR01173387.1~~GHVR01173387.1.p1  ORF type:complete len:137 (+),score=30.80 GHVR01173387.1:294-704(+)
MCACLCVCEHAGVHETAENVCVRVRERGVLWQQFGCGNIHVCVHKKITNDDVTTITNDDLYNTNAIIALPPISSTPITHKWSTPEPTPWHLYQIVPDLPTHSYTHTTRTPHRRLRNIDMCVPTKCSKCECTMSLCI